MRLLRKHLLTLAAAFASAPFVPDEGDESLSPPAGRGDFLRLVFPRTAPYAGQVIPRSTDIETDRTVRQNASFIPPTTLRGAPAKIEPVVVASTLAPFCKPVTALIEFARGWADAM